MKKLLNYAQKCGRILGGGEANIIARGKEIQCLSAVVLCLEGNKANLKSHYRWFICGQKRNPRN